jgi:EAL domain-containing protein (putative c-di-GMP-specific phosphodiesterase class I)
MGHNLDLDIIAEGIEKKAEVNLLRDNSCRRGQGFLFSRPLSNTDIIDVFDFNNTGYILE